MAQEQLTRHEKRLLKREEQGNSKKNASHHGVHVVVFILVVGVIGGVIYGIARLSATTPATTYTSEPVHWHAAFEIEVCGKKQDFSSYGSGQHHAGLPLFHTHGDHVIHVEGRIVRKEDIFLGRFFDAINVPFDNDRIMDRKNGDECPAGGSSTGTSGKPGTVKMWVNGEPNSEFDAYIIKNTENAQDQKIRIVFD